MKVALSVQTLEKFLTKAEMLEVSLLLLRGPSSWSRSYKPLQQHATTVSAVIVSCIGELSFIELVPPAA
jgi:hypothetical protein